MATQANEIGSLRSSAITQRELAAKSREYKCPACNSNHINLVVGGCGLSQEGVASLGAKLLLNMNRRGKAANKSKGPLRADGKQLSNSNLRHNSLQNQKCGQFWRKKDAQRDIVIRRWGISRKALLYSASFLLFGLWKLCVRLIDQHFLTASVSS